MHTLTRAGLEWKYVPSNEGTHMHSCGRAIAAVSTPTSLLFCKPHLAGPLFLMVQNREWGKESTSSCPSFSTFCPLFMSQAVIAAFHDVLLTSNMLAAVYYASCRTWRSGVWYQQSCSLCAPLSFWEQWQPWNDTVSHGHWGLHRVDVCSFSMASRSLWECWMLTCYRCESKHMQH